MSLIEAFVNGGKVGLTDAIEAIAAEELIAAVETASAAAIESVNHGE